MKYDVIIVGAGAAGLMCAIESGRRGRRVALIDHSKSVGEKIRISGGGRCNFTNLDIRAERFISQNPRFAISALKRFTQWDFISMVDAAGIDWHEKTLGQLFCDGSAKLIIAMLMDQAETAGVDVRCETLVNAITWDRRYVIRTNLGVLEAESLVVATGGKSIPKMGATGFGYQLAEQFGLNVIETRPGLVPLTFSEQDLTMIASLSGTALPSVVSCGAARFEEGMLFTHRGLSGPSILQISSYWREGQPISVNLSAGRELANALKADRQQAGRMSIKNALAKYFPEKVAGLLIQKSGLSGNLADQNNAKLDGLAEFISDWRMQPIGTEGYRTAEVTLGGVDTDDLDAKTMEAKSQPGLYFIGEVVDVTGWLGGYNFQWAWSSGWAAGQVA
ncbi:MAG: NAD(P)/FAD-dependent oxidoreductase [Litoreibacter sp.]